MLVAYLHVFTGTPEWAMYFALFGSLLAVADWRASRAFLVTRAM